MGSSGRRMIDGEARVTLLANGVVVTRWENPDILFDGAVAWSGERILEVGPAAELRAKFPAANPVDAHGGLILPGLINLHHHLYSAFARGLAPASVPQDFAQILERLWWRLDRALTPETVRLSGLLGATEAVRWGCTTIFDHHASPSCLRGSLDIIGRTLDEAGLSGVLCYEVSDRNGHEEAVAGLVENLRFIDRHQDDPRLRGIIGLHASFTLTDATLDEVAKRRPPGCGCHIHIAEDSLDREASESAFGAAPLERLESRGLLDERALLVHGVHLRSEGRAVVARNHSVLIHCPESNANNGVGWFDVERAAGEGCTIALGTDGMSAAMLRSLRFAFLIQRAGREDPTVGFAAHPRLLQNNVEVARRFFDEPLLGELAPGAPADICVVDGVPPTPLTADNLFGHLVFGAAEAPVRHTIARGEFLLEDFSHTTLDPQAIAEIARTEAPELWERFYSIGASPVDWLPI
jgi:putative selenium metabolism protein SsnA